MSALVELRGEASVYRRSAALLVAAVGVVFLVSTLANNLFTVGPDFEEMIDDFRPALTEESIATAKTDLVMLEGVGAEFEAAIVPAVAPQLGMTEAEFMSFIEANFPDVASGVAALPEIVPTFNGLVDTLDSQRDLFQSADEIPTEALPATTVPWGFLVAGISLLVIGALLFKPGWLAVALAGGFGVLVVGVVLVLSLIPKAADADELNDNLRPIYTPELVEQAKGALITVEAMGTQMQTEMLPALAQQLGMDQTQLNGFLGENFPATAQALGSMPEALGRFGDLTQTFDDNLDNYETIEPVSFFPIIWTLMVGAWIVLGAAVLAWWGGRAAQRTDEQRSKLGDADRTNRVDLRAEGEAPPRVRVPAGLK
ncbi:MAG: hypothetical protein HKN03_11750 [Acidimicrobiales bacterium]|nr:hypothetical protein [Acidimicrobiales bacterium]